MSWFGFATGKTALYETLVRAYTPDLYRFAFWLCRDRNVAEDLVQETCLRAWKAWQNLNDEKAAKQWLFTILRREHARLYQPNTPLFITVEIDELEALVGNVEMPSRDVHEAIESLAETYREPLLLQILGGFTCKEIAAIMNITEDAVMARVSRARRMMRELLDVHERPQEKQK